MFLVLELSVVLRVPCCRQYFQHAHFMPIVDVGKRGAYLLVHSNLPRQNSFGTTLRFYWPCAGGLFIYVFLSFFNLTYSRWTSSLPSCLWSHRIFLSLPGSRLTIFYRDARSALLQLVNRWLNFTYSRSHAFRYERKNTNPTFGKNRTHDFCTSRCAGYLLDHSDSRQ